MTDVVEHFDLAQRTSDFMRAGRRLPGPAYYTALQWIHQLASPETYVEIGVEQGESLAVAAPATSCIGVDPAPKIASPGRPNVRLFATGSNEFFAAHDLRALLGRDHFSLAFIDGLHLFDQALLDFINLERYAGERSIILLHDCIPLDAATSARTRATDFYTGDTWKLPLCLKDQRPDLHIAIVRTPPSGLCLVSRLDRHSRVLEQRYATCLQRYAGLGFEDYTMRAWQMPASVANTRAAVARCVADALRPGVS